MEVGAAGAYQRGLDYIGVARRLSVAARALDEEDAAEVRKLADGLLLKGSKLLKAAVRPSKAAPPPTGE